MAVSPTKLRTEKTIPDWLPRVILLPSLFSLATHALLLLIFAVTLHSWQRPPVGFQEGEETREVGIVVKQDGDSPNAIIPGEHRDGDTSVTSVDGQVSYDNSAPGRVTSDEPPVETSLPKSDSMGRIGPGVSLPGGLAVPDPRQPVKSKGGHRAPASGTVGGTAGAAFMGTRDQASKVIFVVDASGSMMVQNSMQVAKSALISSIQSLQENQQFLIIFYDDKPSVLNLKSVEKPQLYSATEIHKTLARQKIAGVQPGTGTQHVPALELALRLRPDVIFFLTDAQEPAIHPGEMEHLKQMNTQKTRIHCIEFGVGQEISEKVFPNNFLRKLSRQNGGTYRYYDVTKFRNEKK